MSVSADSPTLREPAWCDLYKTEDWWAIWIGGMLITLALASVWSLQPVEKVDKKTGKSKLSIVGPWAGSFPKISGWKSNPADAFPQAASQNVFRHPLLQTGLFLMLVLAPAWWGLGRWSPWLLLGFPSLFLLATLAYVLAEQHVIRQYNFEYVLWALLVGFAISNTVGTPVWLQSAAAGEFYIKTGLVLLGAEVLLSKLLELGPPGVLTSWVVTPVVLVTTFWFGQRILKMESPSLNMVISADMSVCGVSAAIATGAACRAKKEEVSYAIAVSLFFTAVMMVVQPLFIRAVGMDLRVAAAWLGGTIDSTGAVAAAGAMLSDDPSVSDSLVKIAATVKMIQNVLIGAVAFGVAVYWSSVIEPQAVGARPGLSEVWKRFPRFTLGFLAASLVCSSLPWLTADGALKGDAAINDLIKPVRGWLFCMAFVSIGLETNLRTVLPYLKAGKPVTLYIVGQMWNLLLSWVMCQLMFGWLFAPSGKP